MRHQSSARPWRALKSALIATPLFVCAACTVVEEPSFLDEGAGAVASERGATDEASERTQLAAAPLPLDAEGCPGIYAQDLLPTFELTLSQAVISTLYEDWVYGRERNSLDDDDTPYRPVDEFRYGDNVSANAMIRLRGNPNFWLEQNKMQFQVSFDELDKNGRFLGQRKMLFDAATFNRHFLRDRLSLWVFRQAGVKAPCANNAKLYVNGDYYGLYTNIEKLDDVFLQRVFPGAANGDLWERRSYQLKTNQDSASPLRINELRLAADEAGDGERANLDTLATLMDFEQALRLYAVDAILPNSDGPWAGGLNYYFYDHPTENAFYILPWDLDNTFTRLTADVQPYTYSKETPYHGRPYFNAILEDDVWLERYVEIIEEVLDQVYNQDTLWALTGNDSNVPIDNPSGAARANLGLWSNQLRDAAVADINKPYTNRRMEIRRTVFVDFLRQREVCLREWIECVRSSESLREGADTCVCQLGVAGP